LILDYIIRYTKRLLKITFWKAVVLDEIVSYYHRAIIEKKKIFCWIEAVCSNLKGANTIIIPHFKPLLKRDQSCHIAILFIFRIIWHRHNFWIIN